MLMQNCGGLFTLSFGLDPIYLHFITKCYIFDIGIITHNDMQTSTAKVQTAFRFDKELIRRLKIKAKKENRSLNNYVETVLMDVVYDEPNEETIAAINEVKNEKDLERLNMSNFDEFVAGL